MQLVSSAPTGLAQSIRAVSRCRRLSQQRRQSPAARRPGGFEPFSRSRAAIANTSTHSQHTGPGSRHRASEQRGKGRVGLRQGGVRQDRTGRVGQARSESRGRLAQGPSSVPRATPRQGPLHHCAAAGCSGQAADHLGPVQGRFEHQITDRFAQRPPAERTSVLAGAPRQLANPDQQAGCRLDNPGRANASSGQASSLRTSSTPPGKIRAVSGPKRSRKPVRTNGAPYPVWAAS